MSKKRYSICCICLVTETRLTKIEDAMEWFYEDFCDYTKRKTPSACDACFDVLKKCYLFKKQCNVANKVFGDWENTPPGKRPPINTLNQVLRNYNFESDSESDSDLSMISDPEISHLLSKVKEKSKQNVENPIDKKKKIDKTSLKNNLTLVNNTAASKLEPKNATPEVASPSPLFEPEIDPIKQEDMSELEWIEEDDDRGIDFNRVDVNDGLVEVNVDPVGVDVGPVGVNVSPVGVNVGIVEDNVGQVGANVNQGGNIDGHCDILGNDEEGDDENWANEDSDRDDIKDEDTDREDDLELSKFLKMNKKKTEVKVIKKEDIDSDSEDADIKKILKRFCKKKTKVKAEKKNKVQKRQWDDFSQFESVFDVTVYRNKDEIMAGFNERKENDAYKNAMFKCEVCYIVLRTEKHLKYHHRTSHEPRSGDVVCEVCGIRFRTKRLYTRHKGYAHSARFACKKCPLVTYNTSAMLQHFKMHCGLPNKCNKCDRVFNHRSTLMGHQRLAHPSHVCSVCAKICISDAGLRQHHTMQHREPVDLGEDSSARCQECNLTFVSQDVLHLHRMNHPAHKAERKRHKSTLLGHQRLAHGSHVCSVCAKICISDAGLRQHHKKQHREPVDLGEDSSARCEECNLTFVSQEVLRLHWMNHPAHKAERNREKQLCMQCGQTFDNELALRSHNRIHRQQKFKKALRTCKICGVKARTLYQHHLREHPDRPYERLTQPDKARSLCHLCGRGFKSKPQLAEHMNSHTGARPYACPRCPARFRTRYHLRYHFECHEPPRRQCAQCGKKFISAANLSNHMKTHKGDKCHKCTICDKLFVHSCSLREHVRGVHLNQKRIRRGRTTKPQEQEHYA